ncbi:MAG: trigger factor [Pseudomonadota bacterium]
MQTPAVEEVGENRVRLTVDVPGHDVKHAVDHAAHDLSESVKIPGFRKGKVPMPVLLSRVGRERLMTEAVDSHIGGWFWNAAARTRLRPVSQPRYEYELPATDRDDWRFTAEFDVQPKPELPDWTQLEVGRPAAEVPQELVDAELDVLRGAVAELAPVEGRPVHEGDTVVVDLVNEGGENQRDYVVELGGNRLVEEVEQGLIGMEIGDAKSITFELADDSSSSVDVTVKEIKEKVLPPLDDELARAASEFDTLAELRGDIEGRLRAQIEDEVEAQFRANVADALVAATRLTPAGPLVEARTRELVNGLVRSVERRGVPFDTYLAMTGTQPEALVARMREEATQSVARELVLEAAAERLGIEVSDEQVEQLVREQADAAEEDADAVLEELRHTGGFERLREDLRLRDTLDRLAAEVKPIPMEVAQAREAIWTPDKETPQTETKLWTPGGKES